MPSIWHMVSTQTMCSIFQLISSNDHPWVNKKRALVINWIRKQSLHDGLLRMWRNLSYWTRFLFSTTLTPRNHFLEKVAPCPSMLYSFGMACLCHTTHSLHHVFIQEVWSWHWIQAWSVHVIQKLHPVVMLRTDFPQHLSLVERFPCKSTVTCTEQIAQRKTVIFFLDWQHRLVACAPNRKAAAHSNCKCSHQSCMVDVLFFCLVIKHFFLRLHVDHAYPRISLWAYGFCE